MTKHQDQCDIALTTSDLYGFFANDTCDEDEDEEEEDIFATVPQGGLISDLMLPVLEESSIQQQSSRDNQTGRTLPPYFSRVSLARSSILGGNDDWKVMDPTSVVVLELQQQYRGSQYHDPLDRVIPAPVGEAEDLALRILKEEADEKQPDTCGASCHVQASNINGTKACSSRTRVA
jgi:hypothetical protein